MRWLLCWTAVSPFSLYCARGERDPDSAADLEEDKFTSEHVRRIHVRLDKNGDGRASLDEVMRFSSHMRTAIARHDVQAVLKEMDTDGDEQLSLAELLKDTALWGEDDEYEKEVAERHDTESEKFEVADRNGDGLLAGDELAGFFYPDARDAVTHVMARRQLEHKDTNSDGELNLQEFWEGDALYDEPPTTDDERAEFHSLDADSNGKISLEELKFWESGEFHTAQAMQRLIELSDKDGDGHVTVSELDDARERIQVSDVMYHVMEWAEHIEL